LLLLQVADVEGHAYDLARVLAVEPVDGGRQPRRVPAVERDGHALAQQCLCYGQAYAAARARDERDPVDAVPIAASRHAEG